MGFFHKIQTNIAVEIGSGEIRIAKIKIENKKPEIEVFQFSCPPWQKVDSQEFYQVAAALEKAAEGANIKGTRVISTVDKENLILRQLKVPKMPKSDFKKAITWKAASLIPFPLEELEIRHLILEDDPQDHQGSQWNVLLVATRKEMALTYFECFSRAGLKLAALDLSSIALCRIFKSPVLSNSAKVKAVIEIGAFTSQIVILKQNLMEFVRIFAGGTEKGIKECIRETKCSIEFYKKEKKQKIDQIIVTGRINETADFIPLLEKEVNLKAEIGHPVLQLNEQLEKQSIDPRYAVVCGLAMGEAKI